MKRQPLHNVLAWAVAGSVLLPVVLSVLLGTASLLAALGDAAAAAACRWAAVPLAIGWLVSVAATAVLAGLVVLGARAPRPRGRRRRGPPAGPGSSA